MSGNLFSFVNTMSISKSDRLLSVMKLAIYPGAIAPIRLSPKYSAVLIVPVEWPDRFKPQPDGFSYHGIDIAVV